jgi:hypothetical protein
MDWRDRTIIAFAVIVVIGGIVAVRDWENEHDLRLQAEATTKGAQQTIVQTQQIVAQSQAQVKQLTDAMNAAQAAHDKQIADLNTQVAALKTPNEQLAWVVQQLKAPQPIQVTVPTNPGQAATAAVPQADIQDLVNQVTACKKCQLDLSTSTQQLTYAQQQKQALDDQLKALNTQSAAKDKEIQTWQTAAKGGTLAQRFVRAAKWVGIGVLTGAAAVCGTGHCR